MEPCAASWPSFCSSGRAGSLLSSPPEHTSTTLPWLKTSAGFEKQLLKIERASVLEILDILTCTALTSRANVEFSLVEEFTNEAVQGWCTVKKNSYFKR